MFLPGLFWFLLIFVPLVFLQRLLHREIQVILLILTRNPQLTVELFSILFLPGVFLHELSHFLMARLLGVATRNFSVAPHMLPNGRLRMGYVEIEKTDILRDSLIGLAPLLAGTLFIAYDGLYQLNIDTNLNLLTNGRLDLLLVELRRLSQVSGFYLWFYLVFAVSSTMVPSEADRDAWLSLGMWAVVLFALALLAGAGPWMLNNLAPFLNDLLSTITALFGLSLLFCVVLLLPIMLRPSGDCTSDRLRSSLTICVGYACRVRDDLFGNLPDAARRIHETGSTNAPGSIHWTIH